MARTEEQAQADYASVLRAVQQWPAEARFSLIEDVLRTLRPALTSGARKETWRQASGLLAGDWPSPTDEEVERMLDESRAEKYG